MLKLKIIVLLILFSKGIDAQVDPTIIKDLKDGWHTKPLLVHNNLIKDMDSLISIDHFKQITSIAIAYEGNLVYENYYNESSDSTLHNTRSATKTITGALIGCLIDDNKIESEKTYASKYSKRENIYYPDSRKDSITIEDLLTMSSILECDDWNELSRGNEERMYLIEDWVKFYWDLPIKGYPEWTTKPEESEYGRDFSYCTSGIVVLGDIINTITGNIELYADQAFFNKLGIEKKHWQITPIGIPMTGGGLGLRSRDLLKIGQLYLNKGMWNDKRIISEEWVGKSVSPKAVMPEEYGSISYGYLWWLSEFSQERAYYMTGSGGNKVAIFPNLELVVVLTSTYYNGGMESHIQTSKLLSEYIVPAIRNMK